MSTFGVKLPWSHGNLYAMRLASNAVRITPLGVRFVNTFSVEDFAGFSSTDGQWNRMDCVPHVGAFCRAPDASSMLVFPVYDVEIPDDWARITQNAYTRHFDSDSACRVDSRRVLSVSDSTYDLSLCDLIDSSLDILWRQDGVMLWRVHAISTVEVAVIFVFTLYFIHCVTSNILTVVRRRTLGAAPDPVSRWQITMFFLALLYTSVSLLTASHSLFAQEIRLAVILSLFITVELLVLGLGLCRNAHGISIITALLFLFSFRVYLSFDNPYSTILATLFASRSFYKLLAYTDRVLLHKFRDANKPGAPSPPSLLLTFLVLSDGLVLAAVLDCAVLPVYIRAFEARLMQALVLFLGALIGSATRLLTVSSPCE